MIRERARFTAASAPYSAPHRAATWSSASGGSLQGGDWCDAYQLPDNRTAIAIFDVAGHGDASAPAMAAMRNVFFVAMRSGLSPTAFLPLANALAFGRDKPIMLTAIFGILDRVKREFTFANAGHPPPLLMTSIGHQFLSKPIGDLPLGIFSHYETSLHTVAIPDGALLVLYSDGLTEHNRDSSCGEQDLVDAARATYGLPVLHAARTIAQGVLQTGRGVDDVAIVTARA